MKLSLTILAALILSLTLGFTQTTPPAPTVQAVAWVISPNAPGFPAITPTPTWAPFVIVMAQQSAANTAVNITCVNTAGQMQTNLVSIGADMTWHQIAAIYLPSGFVVANVTLQVLAPGTTSTVPVLQ